MQPPNPCFQVLCMPSPLTNLVSNSNIPPHLLSKRGVVERKIVFKRFLKFRLGLNLGGGDPSRIPEFFRSQE